MMQVLIVAVMIYVTMVFIHANMLAKSHWQIKKPTQKIVMQSIHSAKCKNWLLLQLILDQLNSDIGKSKRKEGFNAS